MSRFRQSGRGGIAFLKMLDASHLRQLSAI
jgi:hypothetical protein